MIIKYFSSGSSKSGAVEYVEKNETARILKGNTNITKELIKNNDNKLKYRSGVLSFGSNRPTKEQVMEIIELFEESTFAGLDKDQYNILWVEHTNTDNYHIHFVIPRLELSTMKAFNPHYYKQDQKRLLKLQDYINRKYHLINPFKAERRQTNLSADIRDNMKDKEIKEMIYKHIDTAFTDGVIENRNDVIKILRDSNFVVKESKNFLGIKKKNGKHIRLKGEYYNERFTSRAEFKRNLRKEEREHRKDTYGELVEAREELNRLIQYKAKQVRARYTKETGEDRRNNREELNTTIARNKKSENTKNTADDMANMVSDIANISINNIHATQRDRRFDTGLGDIHREHGNGGLEDDSIGTTIKRSTRRIGTEQQELNEELKRARERIHEQYINNCEQLQKDNGRTAERTHTAIKQYNQRTETTQSASIRRARNTSETKSAI